MHMENHRNDRSRPPGDIFSFDSGVLAFTALAI